MDSVVRTALEHYLAFIQAQVAEAALRPIPPRITWAYNMGIQAGKIDAMLAAAE